MEALENSDQPPHGAWQRRLGIGLLSILLIVPCFWQAHIETGDFATHVYNAWLASLVSQGKVQGVWLARQSDNVLSDIVLQWLIQHVGADWAQRIAVSAAVLIFAWGAILFISSATGTTNWWFLVPSVAILAYGFVFHMGFFNFYVSMGICLWYLAIFWHSSWLVRMLAVPLLLLAWTAHPLPVAWAAGTATYIALAQMLRPRRGLLLLVIALAGILAVRLFLMHLFVCNWSIKQACYVTGANQVLAFGLPRPIRTAFGSGIADGKYIPLFVILLLIWLVLFRDRVKTAGLAGLASTIPFQLWAMNAAGVLLLPDRILSSQHGNDFSYITHRLSLAAALTACAVLSTLPLRTAAKVGLVAVGVFFFTFVYRDTKAINTMEDRISAAVKQLPPGQRVIGLFPPESVRMNPLQHALDRSCIGHCFSYADYEPCTRMFRVRAQPGNGVVLDNPLDVDAVDRGEYVVQPRDVPIYLVYLCGGFGHEVCTRPLQAGEAMDSRTRLSLNR